MRDVDGSSACQGVTEGFDAGGPDQAAIHRAQGPRSRGDEVMRLARTLQQTLEDFGIMVEVADWSVGPSVTLFKVAPPSGTCHLPWLCHPSSEALF